MDNILELALPYLAYAGLVLGMFFLLILLYAYWKPSGDEVRTYLEF